MKKYSDKGNKTLEVLNSASNFTNWMYYQVKPFLKGDILEIGSGRGTYSDKIIKDFPDSKIILSDIDKEYVDQLNLKYGDERIRSELINVEIKENFEKLNQKVDSVFALNVLEHVEKDVDALNNIYSILNDSGKFIMLVPAHQFLYNDMDKEFGHYRRYSAKEIKSKVKKTNFKIKEMYYFNFFSIFGWFFFGNILKKKSLGENSVGIFDKLVFLFKFVETYILRKKLGISIVVVLEK